MTNPPKKQKLYAFVDETGQDTRSKHFIVVSVLSADTVEELRASVIELESQSKVGRKKWHKLRSPEREAFLDLTLKHHPGLGHVFYGTFVKPLPFFLPMLETLVNAITALAADDYQAVVYVDGIDHKKSEELTNALRLKGVKVRHVRSARDESEPLIRLADRWAGCIREGIEGNKLNQRIVDAALAIDYLREIGK